MTMQAVPMDALAITETLQRDAVWVVSVNVLLQQLGLPVPAVPTLLIAGSIASSPSLAAQWLAAAVLASLLADLAWYLAGRAFGYRVLSVLCRLSINPASCVSATEARFVRWGVWSLVVAKFVPGFSTVAPPIAGSLRMPLPSFLAAAGLGAALWAGAALLAGHVLRAEVHTALDLMGRHATTTIAMIVLGLGVWLGWKLRQRRRFGTVANVPHVNPPELKAALDAGAPLLLLDLRGAAMIAQTGPIEGATQTDLDSLARAVNN